MGNSRRANRASDKAAARPAASAANARPIGKWVAIGVGVIAFVALVAFISRDVAENPQGRAEPPAGFETVEVGAVVHTEDPVSYGTKPGAGGPHNPQWLTCRAYSDPVLEEMAVHTLEHGAIWITYQPDLPAADIDALEGFTRSNQVMSSPYPGLDSPVVLTAWARRLPLDTVDTAVIDQFIRAFRDATAPEIAAAC